MTENGLLEAASLYKRYGGVQAPSGADLVVRRGAVEGGAHGPTSTAEQPAAERA